MNVFTSTSPRILLRRTARQHQGLSPIQKRPKATCTENQISRTPKEQLPSSTTSAGYPLLVWRRVLPPYRLVTAYQKAQEKRPYATQAGTVVLIWCFGDLLAQNFGEEDYDPWRTLRHMTIGAIISIPSYTWCEEPLRSNLGSLAHSSSGSCTLGARSTTPPNFGRWLRRLWSIRSRSHHCSVFTSLACSHCYLGILSRMLGSG